MQRNTRQKSAILHAIEHARRPLSPQEILAEASQAVSQIGMATIYRNLKSLVDDGALKVVTLPCSTCMRARATSTTWPRKASASSATN